MLRISVRTKEYEIKFRHNSNLYPSTQYRGYTDCFVNKPDAVIDGQVISYDIVGSATAWCSIKDNFSRATGRKISLGRALLKAFPDKEDRRYIWEQYFKKLGVVHQ